VVSGAVTEAGVVTVELSVLGGVPELVVADASVLLCANADSRGVRIVRAMRNRAALWNAARPKYPLFDPFPPSLFR
jgi:hypothetical protein